MSDILITQTRGALLGASMLILAACSGQDVPPSDSVSVTPPVVEEVVVPAEPETIVLETLFSDLYPDADMTGSARYDGSVVTMVVGDYATISDNSMDKYETYTPAIQTLNPGLYRLSATLRQTRDRAEQALIRVQSADAANSFLRSDLTLSSGGAIAKSSGAFVMAETEDMTGGFDRVTVEFEVGMDQAGSFRFTVYPAIGSNNRYATEAVGSIDIGRITLESIAR